MPSDYAGFASGSAAGWTCGWMPTKPGEPTSYRTRSSRCSAIASAASSNPFRTPSWHRSPRMRRRWPSRYVGRVPDQHGRRPAGDRVAGLRSVQYPAVQVRRFPGQLAVAALAHASGLGYQLGCHPGETGILSAAGRHWATSVGGIRYLEGSYDRHLLRELVTCEDITFGYGGRAPALRRPGLGVTINPTSWRG